MEEGLTFEYHKIWLKCRNIVKRYILFRYLDQHGSATIPSDLFEGLEDQKLVDLNYSTFIQELKGLVLFYERSIKVTKHENIKENMADETRISILWKIKKLIEEKNNIRTEHKALILSKNFYEGHTWLDCKNMIKDPVGDNKYIMFLNNEEYDDNTPEVIKDIEYYLMSKLLAGYGGIKPFYNKLKQYSKDDLLKAKSYIEQHLVDLKASIAVTKSSMSSNYYGNFMKDLVDIVRKYGKLN